MTANAERDERQAVGILRGECSTPPEMLVLAKRLHAQRRTGIARRLLMVARRGLRRDEYRDVYLEIFQKSALYTYKDPDLPLQWRLERALQILREVEDLSRATNQETLGITGAIYKRMWEVDGRRHHLERALFYYLKGYAQGAPVEGQADVLGYLVAHPDTVFDPREDRGYTGINAAFVLDLLASLEDEEAREIGLPSASATQRREHAARLRREIIRSVACLKDRPDLGWLRTEWWYYATIGEAYFGLGEYGQAVDWLRRQPAAAGLVVPDWEYESTARQLARLARARPGTPATEEAFRLTLAGQALREILAGDDLKVASAFRGKFGLALSGGGFRAALFHIGVLARLAELDVLRHVEVLSCVSGGSIVGAYYYLELRRLLQSRTDDQIGRDDYVGIVRRLETEFLTGVQRNVRTRVLAQLSTNLKLMFWPGYSRTLRVGELYEREIFARVADNEGRVDGSRWLPDWLAKILGYRREPRWLNELNIQPLTADGLRQGDFKPRADNWRRAHKVPVLVLNATSLNTGHNWQFTTTYMGEPPTPINAEIDGNERLRRMWYADAPTRWRKVRLGHAVAASSCVPGIFEPLALDGLFPDRSVRLVDGGVCDNQGIATLLEQDCSVMLVSDGSGQMDAQAVPSRGVLRVPVRSNDILMARVRDAQYRDVAARRGASLLQGLLFVHLKQDILGEPVAWVDCPPHHRESDFERARRLEGRDTTTYGIAVDTQRRLAAVRTDLDSFCDAEAAALMASGYRMTRESFGRCVAGFALEPVEVPWRFRQIERTMCPDATRKPDLDCLLAAAASAGFKIWRLALPLIVLKWVLGVVALVGVVTGVWRAWDSAIIPPALQRWTWGDAALAVLSLLVIFVVSAVLKAVIGRRAARLAMRTVRWRDTLTRVAVGFSMALVGWIVARIHLHVFDRWYLCYGRLERFVEPPAGGQP